MDKEFKDILEKSSEAIEKLQDKVEGLTEDFTEDSVALWGDMKKYFTTVNDKLKDASKDMQQKTEEAHLQARLGTMEALERVEGIKESMNEFTKSITAKTQAELDTVALRAHLAKMEAEDFWESKGKKMTQDFEQSSEKMKDLTLEAATEIRNYFDKLTESMSKKS